MIQSQATKVVSVDSPLKIVIFRVNTEEYGVDVSQIKSIERMCDITRVPNVEQYIIGVMNLRGSVIPVINLRKRFGFQVEEYKDETRIIVLKVEDVEVGIVVDSCSDVIDINRGDIEPPPSIVGGVESSYIQGVTKNDQRLIILLDLEKTLNM
jgi:purine-binding chemotaxis protein CheW